MLRWRYGKHFRKLVPELKNRERWGEEQWRDYQLQQLRSLIARAVEHVPYYRETYGQLGIKPDDIRCLEDIRFLPIVSKEEVRAAPQRFLADDCNPHRMIKEHTSGSTGTPLYLWWSVKTSQANYAFMEARIRNWAGVKWGERWAMLGGQYVVPVERRTPPYWVWSLPYRQLYMSVYHISPESAPLYFRALQRYGVQHVYGYASALYALAASMQEEPPPGLKLKAIFSNAEPLYDHYREAIGKTFGAQVYDTYSSAELTAFASECEHGTMHLSPDFGIVEVLSEGEPTPHGQIGELIATGLINWDMPLIRYETGDRVALGENKCPCGRQLPVLQEISGRINDLIVTPDGRRVYLNMTAIGKWANRIFEFQVIQDRIDHLFLRVVPAEGYTQQDGIYVRDRIQQRLGDIVAVELLEVSSIPRGPAGKFQAIVSNVAVG